MRLTPKYELEAQQALLDCCNEATLLLTRHGVIRAANLSAGAWLDRPTPEIIGTELGTLLGEAESVNSLLEGLPDLALGQRLNGVLIVLSDPERRARVSVSRVPDFTHGLDEEIFLLSARPETSQDQLLADAMAVNQRVEELHLTLAEVKRQLMERTLQLAEQRKMMQVVLWGIGDGLLVFDERGLLIECNDVALKLLNVSGNEIIGRPLSEVCAPLHKALGGWQGVEFGLINSREDIFHVGAKELRAGTAPLRGNNDVFLGCVVVLIDRTKEAEVDRLKSDLISIVSHELRSPLTSIKGYIDLLVAGDLGEIAPEQKGYLEIVLTNANRLSSLIDDMLDLSRIESGKLQMTFGKVEVRYLIDYCLMTLKPQAAAKKITLRSEIADPTLVVAGDVERLQQALMNLMGNAIKYSPENREAIVSTSCVGDEIRIAVIDRGIGIAPEHQARLFEKFFRVKNAATRGIGGTGLGLCITKSIVEAHAGRIEVQSEEGEGSTFTIVLPTYETSPVH